MLKDVLNRVSRYGYSFSTRLIEIVEQLDRGLFVQSKYRGSASDDRPLPIPESQTISAPHMVLMMLAKEALDVQLGEKILEIGTGSGYNAAIISHLVGNTGELITIERHKNLVEFARNNMMTAEVPPNYRVIHGDGTLGIEEEIFDKIIVTATGPYIPENLLDQLKVGGILVIPVKSGHNETLIKVTKLGEPGELINKKAVKKYLEKKSKYKHIISVKSLSEVRFVPLIGEYGFSR